MTTETRPVRSAGAIRAYRRAWWSLALFPVSFVLAFVTGEGLIAVLGYESGGATPPFWAVLTAGVPALAVFSVPALLSLWCSRTARRLGHPDSMVPALVGVVVAGGFAALNVVTYVVGQLVAG